MKKFAAFTFILELMCSATGYAASKTILVQCASQGPVYTGVMDLETDIDKWEVNRCYQLGDPMQSHGALVAPMFRIAFNGIEYRGESQDTNVALDFQGAECKGDRSFAASYVTVKAKNGESGYSVFVYFNLPDGHGNTHVLSDTFSFGECAAKIKSDS